MTLETVAGRLEALRAEMEKAAERSGRSGKDLTLVAVSKMHDASAVLAAVLAGQRDFGENYVQKALAKMTEVDRSGEPACSGVRWHFIGRLQKNKAKFLPGRFVMLHSLDSSGLAHTLHKSLVANQAPALEVLIQVNLVGEEQKGGVAEQALPALAEEIMGMRGLILKGLMFMPPFDVEPDDRRPLFARIRKLRDETGKRLGVSLPVLSMGMTDDFVQAILEGATHVRIGTGIFGARQCAT